VVVYEKRLYGVCCIFILRCTCPIDGGYAVVISIAIAMKVNLNIDIQK
jgi:hypothetical protein